MNRAAKDKFHLNAPTDNAAMPTFKIKLLVMPSHASHLLQPLDLAVFGPLKAYMSAKLNKVTMIGVDWLIKHEWLRAYVSVHPIAFRASNIASGCYQAGLVPFIIKYSVTMFTP
jgi:hypothetical protein